jgi:hypothetical protein
MIIKAKHNVTAVTICATNYMARALALKNSYLSFHPESDFYILIIGRKHDRFKDLAPDLRFIWVEDLGIEDFSHYAMKFDIIELSTNVKAVILKKLLAYYDTVLYLDPDIIVYKELEPVFEALKMDPIVITPHTLTPVMDGKIPSDMEFLRFGAFNLGFIGVARSDETIRFLDWWSRRCLDYGYYEPQIGLAVDQKWIDLAPSFFPGVKILRDVGLNVAFWNLHERAVSKREGGWLINGNTPLLFFHFSSFETDNPHSIARKQSRYAAESRPDLHELLDSYAARLQENENESYSKCAYNFNYFDDGMYITPSLRRVYAALESEFPLSENPFSSGSFLQRFAIAHNLAGEKYKMSKPSTFKDIGTYSKSVRAISIVLRYVLRVVGPNKYFSLMRYLAYISSIRNQSDVFSKR